ncbi:MAG: beta-propeller fold lactonase family protein, partial [Candidatus Acidiferrum sp.]
MFSGKSAVKLFGMCSTVAAFALLGFVPGTRLAAQSTGDVYVLSNSEENAVIVFHRNADGTIERAGSFRTGGSGAGSGTNPLHSQGPVILSADNRMLFAVNAGSNSISAFAVSGDELTLLQTIPSGGERPVSLTVSHDLLYVLNNGDSPNISGFRIVPEGSPLVPMEGSTRALPRGEAAHPAEVSFNPEGNVLLVSEAGTSMIDSFTVADEGRARFAYSYPSSGSVPFGFAFGRNNVAVAAYTDNAAPGQGGVGSYKVTAEGDINAITPAVNDQGTASTWLVVTGNGATAFTTNAVSGTISSYAVSPEDGSLSLTRPVAAALRGEESGSLFPSDMALSNNSRYLYVRNGANGTVSGFILHSDGSLAPVASAEG